MAHQAAVIALLGLQRFGLLGLRHRTRILMGSIELSGIEKWFGEAQVIKGIDLNIKAGEFIIFVGPPVVANQHYSG